MITIIDYGMGNLGSIKNMFKKIHVPVSLSNNKEEISKASKIVLPGVGSFDAAMQRIHDLGIKEILDDRVLEHKIPILGICLGMQLIVDQSEEGKLPGFSWIRGSAKRFHFNKKENLKVPHMGWNLAKQHHESSLLDGYDEVPQFYFVHSYYVNVEDSSHAILRTEYGGENFVSGIQKENIYGVQFHPEKSHKYGMKLFQNFSQL